MQRVLILAAAAILSACDSDNDSVAITPEPAEPPPAASFDIVTTNLTLGQPLSPIAAMIHDSELTVFTIGESASPGLELLAEGGDNSELLEEIDSSVEISGEAPLGPGASETLTLTLPDDQIDGLSLSVVSMLVNTNDAITSLNSIDLSTLSVGETMMLVGNAYDAGTELNSELAGTIPGPADGGEGFNAARDDVGDFVTMHPGVVTSDDGMADSVLSEPHRFDNPVVRFAVTRTQ